MNIVCSKEELLKGVTIVQKAVPTRTTMSILECILIDATGDEIKLTANDMEIGIETVVNGKIIEGGVVAIEAKFLSDVVRKPPDNDRASGSRPPLPAGSGRYPPRRNMLW